MVRSPSAAPAAGAALGGAMGEGLLRVPRGAVEEGDGPGCGAQRRRGGQRRALGRLGRRGGTARGQEAVLGGDQRWPQGHPPHAAAAGPRHVLRLDRRGQRRPRAGRGVRGGAARHGGGLGGEPQAAGGQAAGRLRAGGHRLGRRRLMTDRDRQRRATWCSCMHA